MILRVKKKLKTKKKLKKIVFFQTEAKPAGPQEPGPVHPGSKRFFGGFCNNPTSKLSN
jgi:hypothetical protein